MKAVMYHYVRPDAAGLPYFPFLHLTDFERQLDFFATTFGFVGRDDFVRWRDGGPAPNGVLLTFDDGLRDHAEFVLPKLRARGLFGLFYAPSSPALTGKLLDVHKIHLALGKLGSTAALGWLKTHTPEVLPPASEGGRTASHYAAQSSDATTKFIKHLFNWQLSAAMRRKSLDGLLDFAFAGAPPGWRELYLDETGLRSLSDSGMGVGPHGHSHEVPVHLSLDRQNQEVVASCEYIERVGGSRRWGYCYPYGSTDAITDQTKAAVASAGCPLAFAVAPEDIDTPLVASARYALPRHNCNAFPYGAVSYGEPE